MRIAPRSGPFPRTAVVTMRYVSDGFINPLPNTVGSLSFRANSIFDPDVLVGGHQPYGHDTLETVYAHYDVISAKCTATFTGTAGGEIGTGIAFIKLSTLSAHTFDRQLIREQPGIKWKIAGSIDSTNNATLSKNFNASQFWGGKRGKTNQSAHFGNNPSEQAYFHVGIMSTNDTTNVAPTAVNVTITYKVRVSDPIALGGS